MLHKGLKTRSKERSNKTCKGTDAGRGTGQILWSLIKLQWKRRFKRYTEKIGSINRIQKREKQKLSIKRFSCPSYFQN